MKAREDAATNSQVPPPTRMEVFSDTFRAFRPTSRAMVKDSRMANALCKLSLSLHFYVSFNQQVAPPLTTLFRMASLLTG